MGSTDIISLEARHMGEAAALRRVALWARLPWLPDVHTPEEDEHYWRTHLLPGYTLLGATVEHRLVGVIAHGRGWVEQLYVLPAFQDRGIGSLLLGEAKGAMDDIQLWTFSKNAGARSFYERHGFVAERETDGDNEEREPDILYRWRRPSA
ncbi:acetyltransferase [Rhizobium sp. AC44/96]|uniref:GNAT family N-acetyltransferase n=1 Tax=Rhizobium sp. AC44/96 TaxID=1841654 RepID=UPI00080FC07F|nr:GNAT family N-acetyltransferase [Rhizobium sp. AC44/96]OCJ02639.1 acetyltransferase [Rhizobium sp. AC44/96]